ncbi:hypothetical protein A4S05_38175 [Nostoc sp. KVJ20]|uniref:hypothetical protein n=1 Tax=Nostoc sp. KVJ20 TaxID=457944 RepID=UPI00083DDD9F|nr:hypothetical protein [Nostoc sp. KVJ20]ODG99277.1 hypothetical protein A4S05_38175 [Nostoc sp. KVJ20]
MGIGYWVLGDRTSPKILTPLLKTQIFPAIAWATSNCLPAAHPKQKKGIREWGKGQGGRGDRS